MPLFALVDCNSFYVSCECVFQLRLRGRAVVVLSNNDGCVVARSRAAKALGIAMGQPFFQIKHLVDAGDLVALSSNYTLYGDMSRRVMRTLADFGRRQEVYSIDECFLDLAGEQHPEVTAAQARARVLKYTGIPTSVGVGCTKTLAKLASELAKDRPDGVFVCPSPGPALAEVLAGVAVGDVWGIGPRMQQQLSEWGVTTALDLARLDAQRMKTLYGITGVRVIEELRGESCLEIEEHPAPKQSITCSRSFSTVATTLDELRAATAAFVEIAGEKVRRGRQCASSMTTFVERDHFDPNAPRCDGACTVNFPVPTNLTCELMRAADVSLRRMWRAGGRWKKAGVMMLGLVPEDEQQTSFLDQMDRDRGAALMTAVDAVNRKHGRQTLRSGTSHLCRRWRPRADRCSPRFTTRWDELPVVH